MPSASFRTGPAGRAQTALMNRESSPTTKTAANSDRRRDIRIMELVGTSALVAAVGIDLLDLSDEFADSPPLGIGYVAFIGGSVAAITMIARHDRRGWIVAGSFALAAVSAFVLDHTAGLRSGAHDIGTWTALGIVAVIAESAVVALAAVALYRTRPTWHHEEQQ